MNNEKTLSQLVDYLRDNEPENMRDSVNGWAQGVVTAGTVAAIIMSASPGAAIAALSAGVGLLAMKPGNALNHLPDSLNFKDKSRELTAREQGDKLSLAHLMLIHLAARDAFEEKLLPILKAYGDNFIVNEEDRAELEQLMEESSRFIADEGVGLPNHGDQSGVDAYLDFIFTPMVEVMYDYMLEEDSDENDMVQMADDCILLAKQYYNAYLLSLATEFPEFGWWVDLSEKEQLIRIWQTKLQQTLEKTSGIEAKLDVLLAQIELLHADQFTGRFALQPPELAEATWLTRHALPLSETGDNERLDKISAHHNILRKYINKTIVANEDLAGMENPTNEQMYIPQSYLLTQYSAKTKHYLSPGFWEETNTEVLYGEDIGRQLHRSLIEPANSHKPILILGHPGAGKSMLSQMLAAQLCDHKDYVPFFIKLRDVKTSNNDVKGHIDEGLRQSIEASAAIDWFDWARECKTRIPVVILDGFDELLQVSATELNGYLTKIQQFQEKAYDMYHLCLRVIITSRLSIMQEVTIPEGTTIMKLNSFDHKRKEQWVERWNRFQSKDGYKPFRIPDNEHLAELSKEPLLLLLLAIYDYENSDLQEDAKHLDFNRSKLYDKLFSKFTLRQLNKDRDFIHWGKERQEEEIQQFRLRLGLIAFMMFVQDETSHSGHELARELKAFGLGDRELDVKKVFGGFFFIHENKATGETGNELYNYEFLHKTFGEFLAADFLLRMARKRAEREDGVLGDEQTFRFCYGYNWLHKHSKIVAFFMEHAPSVVETTEGELKKWVKTECTRSMLGTSQLPFPANAINLIPPKPIVEHLAIYTQNLILLLLSLHHDAGKDMELDIFTDAGEENGNSAAGEASGHMTQDEWPGPGNILWWKQMVALWNMAGNHAAAGKLTEWADIKAVDGKIRLSKKNHRETSDYFGSYSNTALNDFHTLLQYYYSNDFNVENVIRIARQKNGLIYLALDVIHARYDDIIRHHDMSEGELVKRLQSAFHFDSDEFLSSKLAYKVIMYLGRRKFSSKLIGDWMDRRQERISRYIDVVEMLDRKGDPGFWGLVGSVMPMVLGEPSPRHVLRLMSLIVGHNPALKSSERYALELIEGLLRNYSIEDSDAIELLQLIVRIPVDRNHLLIMHADRLFKKIDLSGLDADLLLDVFELLLMYDNQDRHHPATPSNAIFESRKCYDALFWIFRRDSRRVRSIFLLRFIELSIASGTYDTPEITDLLKNFARSYYDDRIKNVDSKHDFIEARIKSLELLIIKFGDIEDNRILAVELIEWLADSSRKNVDSEDIYRIMKCMFSYGRELSNFKQLVGLLVKGYNWDVPGHFAEKVRLLEYIHQYEESMTLAEFSFYLQIMLRQYPFTGKVRTSMTEAYHANTKLLYLARQYDLPIR
ncbi:NACHT domain-containing protein [Paenibacillus sp. GCM10027627]|uniref:NACHT domain-containing protein n=1 Tax=unclassified Paenibacillus TaxID=185978 RepID=UPI0036413D6B